MHPPKLNLALKNLTFYYDYSKGLYKFLKLIILLLLGILSYYMYCLNYA